MATYDRDLLNFNQENGSTLSNNFDKYNQLPDTLALSLFSSKLLEIEKQLSDAKISDEKKLQILKQAQAKSEENYSKLDYKRKKELYDKQQKNIKQTKEELKELKDLADIALKATGSVPEEIQKLIDSNEAQLKEVEKSAKDIRKERKGYARGSNEYKELTEQLKKLRAPSTVLDVEQSIAKTKDSIKQKLGVKDTDASGKDQAGQAISAAINKLAETATKYFTQAEDILTQYNARISARLEGSGKQYTDLSKVIKQNLSVSTIAKQTDVLQNLAKLVDSGIAYNLEQRAFLATVKDDIAQTFDVFDGNLAQMIRLQRTDSTYARLGLEASLQSFFNENFLDTSYLTELRRAVSGALIDVEATMVNEEATQFEYIVQKWLGSLYSMGASSSLVNQIASGLNMLGTGNVQGLAGSSMQTLFAMAANRSGTSYADLLTGGLTANKTNDLLKAMVEYLAEISDSTKENRVVSGAYNTIFNMTQADLRAMRNITNDISNIYTSNLNYNQLSNAATSGFYNLVSRVPLQKQAKTLMENLKFGAAENIINNPYLYLTLMATNFLEDMTGGINIEAAPFGIGISATATDLIKGGMFGISFLSEVLSNLDNLNTNGFTGAGLLNTTPGEMRGTGFNLTERTGTSQSYTAGGSTADINNQNLQQAANMQKETQAGLGLDEDSISVEDIFNSLVNGKNEIGRLTAVANSNADILAVLNNSYVSDLKAQRVVITGFNIDTNSSSGLEFPVKFGAVGTEQLRGFTNNLSTSIKGTDDATLYMLLNVILGLLAENGAINVNLESSSLPLTDLVTGKGTPVASKQLPSGNNISIPQTTVRNTASRANVRDYNMVSLY